MINILYTVDPIKRIVKPMSGHAVTEQDHEASSLRFAFPDNIAGTGLDSTGTAVRVMYVRPDGGDPVAKTLTFYKHSGGYYLYDWNLQKSDLQKEGHLVFSLCILDISSGDVEEWHTTPCQIRVLDTIHTDDSDEADESITPTVAQRVAVLETMIQRIASGAPIVVSSVSAMTDTERIYVLTTDGKWYYYDGSAWVAGGEYGGVAVGSVTTDKLANKSVTTAKLDDSSVTWQKLASGAVHTGELADSAVTNVKLADSSVSEEKLASSAVTATKLADGAVTTAKIADGAITAGKIASGVIPTIDTTLTQSGIPADAKAAGDAVKAVQTDVSEHTTELGLLITKTEKPQPEPTEIVQCADLSNATLQTAASGNCYGGVKIELPWNGRYDMNPSNLNLRFWLMEAYDSYGNKLQLYRDGTAFASISCVGGGYIEKVDSRTIKTYKPSGVLDWTWTTDGDVAYLSNNIRNAYIGYFADATQLVGVTYGGASETYIPYGDSVIPDTPPEYDYEYSADLMSAIHDGLVETYTDDEPTQDSTNFVKSGGVISYLLKETYNLIDPLWFDWSDASADYITLKTGLYIPVEAGRFLMSNAEKVRYTFYDSEKVRIDTVGSAVAYAPVAIPSNSAYMTCMLNNQSSGYIPSDHKIVIYYSDNTASPRDDIRDYIGHMNLQGMRGSNEIFDYYAPTALDKEVLQMAKYSAVRNINFCNNVLRIGTFNMYNPRRDYGWKIAKKMFADFAVDIVGFQEVSNAGVLTEFLKGWQFTDGVTWTNRAIASHFEVLSYDTYSISVTNNTFMRAIIQLPRYADVINPTLSVYDYHGIWEGGTPEKRAQEVSEILAVIAQDTSDFIVVVGDTNAQSASEWDTWRNAGFTPVHDGNGVITTIDEYCIDNVFYGSGITCKNYHVVPAEDYLVTISGEDLPISDHDFVFADLQFDFDSLIRS